MEPLKDDSTRDWTEPGIYTVAPGVYRIPLPLPNDGLKSVNVYAVTDGTRLVLVDAGWAREDSRERLRAGLAGIGAELGDIDEFLITHIHRDHYSQAVTLRREFGCHVTLGQAEEPSLKVSADPDQPEMAGVVLSLHKYGAGVVAKELAELFGDRLLSDRAEWETPDEWLTGGTREVLPGRDFQVVPTPGHTSGHLVFADDAAGLLFSGDHVLPHITPSIGFQAVPADLPLGDFLDSLRLVREMPDRRLLPAHGPVTESAHQRVDELLAHHAERLTAMGETIANGASTALEAAGRLGWTRRRRELNELDAFNKMLAVLETAAHLDLLVAQGSLTSATSGGVRHYGLN
ncbi:MBL fold metallo-hydrolase [Amycolatopsis nigrescens]|uniref:MBL fold metallo-hydrolase n=1 Tax=Amycolatopsis nigrescens TaxID=381445 RepID=UPI000364DE30|nr:MBL fold metallo-hydrolase [Amycolatopsis nigrescens]